MKTPTTALLLAVLAAPAAGLDDTALRAGLSRNPDQIHAGLQFEAAAVERLSLRPSFDLGVGNGVRLLSLGGDFVWRLGRRRPRGWFVGGGPGLNVIDVTEGVGEARGVELKPVLHALGGLRWGGSRRRPPRYSIELRAGVGDTPDWKLTLGLRL